MNFMPRLIFAISFFLATSTPYASLAADAEQSHYPTNRDSEIVGSLAALDGQVVAVEVQVQQVAQGPHGKPYLRTTFSDGKGPLWLASVVGVSGLIRVGDVIHVLGYAASIDGSEKDKLKSLNPSGYHILAICYYNFGTKRGLFFPFKSEPNQCSRWRDGAKDGL